MPSDPKWDHWSTSCPKCGALEEQARLEIVHLKIDVTNCPLRADGYALAEACVVAADVEKVHCRACEEVFDLADCELEDP